MPAGLRSRLISCRTQVVNQIPNLAQSNYSNVLEGVSSTRRCTAPLGIS